MRGLVICLFAIVMSFCNCNAQRKINSSKKTITTSSLKSKRVKQGCFLKDLMGTEWHFRTNNHRDKYIRDTYLFTPEAIIFHRVVEKNPKYNESYRNMFYLADSIPNCFDESQVGKSEYGKYIVERYESGKFVAMKIQEFTEDSMILFIKHIPRPDDRYRKGGGDVTLRYYRINKPEPYNGESLKNHTDNEDVSVMKEPDMREP